MGSKVKVGLVYGGKSGEHEVSLSTAFAVMKEFDYSKYEIKPFYITKQGQWITGPSMTEPPASGEQLRFEASEATNKGTTHAALFSIFSALDGVTHEQQVDIMFPLLHGTFGEDGTIQGLFEMANIPYVGTGVLASSVGMDKVFMKKAFADANLPQCVFRYFTKAQWLKDQSFFLMECEIALGYPCFVKPANLGSSVGVSKANNREELIKAIDYAFRFDRKVIIEEFIDAREVEVSVLGNDEPKASIVGEIISSNDFYDYKAKYIDGKSTMAIPANVDEAKMNELREMAITAFKAIDGTGLSRADFFLERKSGKIYINELNTLPGFTPFSMYPLLWRESGLNYQQLLDELLNLAFDRHAAKQQIDFVGDNM